MANTSVNGTLANGTQAWNQNDEINSCSYNEDKGPRVRSRPQNFCDSVSVAGAFTAQTTSDHLGPATFADTAEFAETITVAGITYAPAVVQVGGFYLSMLVDVRQIPLLPVFPPTPPAP